MFSNNHLVGFGGGVAESGYEVDAVVFDGTNDYMERDADLTGAANGKEYLGSFWFNLNGGDGANQVFLVGHSDAQELLIRRLAANTLEVYGKDVSNNFDYRWATSDTFVASGGWVHVMFSRDGTNSHVYIDDAAPSLDTDTNVNDTLDRTFSGDVVFSSGDGVPEALLNADVAEFYLAYEYLDLSVESNRRKFISATGKPVDLGTDGSTPTGTQPIIYFGVVPGAAASTFAVNKGSGGGMTLSGALTIAATSPSD